MESFLLSYRLAIITSDPASTPKARNNASGDVNIAEVVKRLDTG